MDKQSTLRYEIEKVQNSQKRKVILSLSELQLYEFIVRLEHQRGKVMKMVPQNRANNKSLTSQNSAVNRMIENLINSTLLYTQYDYTSCYIKKILFVHLSMLIN